MAASCQVMVAWLGLEYMVRVGVGVGLGLGLVLG